MKNIIKEILWRVFVLGWGALLYLSAELYTSLNRINP